MPQVYFLSVVTLLIGGMTLARAFVGERFSFLSGWPTLVEGEKTRRIIAIVTVVVGLLKLIVRSPGETIPVGGDFLPAIAGIVVGGLLLYEDYYVRKMAGLEEEEAEPNAMLLGYRDQIGMAAVIIGMAHFLLPSVTLL